MTLIVWVGGKLSLLGIGRCLISGATWLGMQTARDLQYFIYRQGKEWQYYRQPLQKFSMVPRKVAEYHDGFNQVTEDLLRNIEEMEDPKTGVLKDVPELFYRWSFECKWCVHVLKWSLLTVEKCNAMLLFHAQNQYL